MMKLSLTALPARLRLSLIVLLPTLLAACGPEGTPEHAPQVPPVVTAPAVPLPPEPAPESAVGASVPSSGVPSAPATVSAAPAVPVPTLAQQVIQSITPTSPPPAPANVARQRPTRPMMSLYGATVLQTREVKLDSSLARESFDDLHRLGANTVVLIPFMKQAHAKSDRVEHGDAVTDEQLMAGIDAAHAVGMRVILKPQMLVGGGGWAGDINPGGAYGWNHWFESYQRQILRYAEIAQATHAEVFVIGTELKQSDKHPYWRKLIAEIRRVYGGPITYAAHNVEGMEQFAHWDLLDMMGVTLYPALGSSGGRSEMRNAIQNVVREIERIHTRVGKPVLVTEIGIPSVAGAQRMPWDYSKKRCDAPPDADLQATVIDLWFEALNRSWVSGVLVWNWYSDPYAGGRWDNDYTVQHKPAESVLRCRWSGECRG